MKTHVLPISPDTRRLLKQAGFDPTDWDDRQLSSIEYTAKALAEGGPVFVPEPMERPVSILAQSQEWSKRPFFPLRTGNA